jgi:hypothetical protein
MFIRGSKGRDGHVFMPDDDLGNAFHVISAVFYSGRKLR